MNNADGILSTNEVNTNQNNNQSYQSVFNIYLEIALRKVALASILPSNSSLKTSLENTSMIESDFLEAQNKDSVNIPSITFPSPLSCPYTELLSESPTSSVPISHSSSTKTTSSLMSKDNVLYKTRFLNTTRSTPQMIDSSLQKLKSNINDSSTSLSNLNNSLNLLSILNQYSPSLNTWNSIQNLVQLINKEIPINLMSNDTTQDMRSSSTYNKKLSEQKTTTYSVNSKENETLEHFCQQQLNQINHLNNLLMNYIQNTESNNDRIKSNHSNSMTREDNDFISPYGSSLHINSPSLAPTALCDTNNPKNNYKNNYRHPSNSPYNFNHSYDNSLLPGTKDESNYQSKPQTCTITRGLTIEEKTTTSSNQKNEYKNTSLLDAVDNDNLNNFDNYENKLIIDIPIEINPVIEKIRRLNKKSEVNLMISKVSEFCDEKLKKIANTLFLNIERCITNILVLAPFVLSKVSYILDPTYSHDIINSSTASNFTRSTTSLLSYTKIVIALHDTWYLNGPQDIDIKVTQEICSKLLEAISSIRRKVDRIKLTSEGQKTKNNLQASYPQLISTCYFYVTLLDDLMNSIVKIDKMAMSSSLASKNPDPEALSNRQRHPPRDESLAVQYKLTENSRRIENYINRVEVGSKNTKFDRNQKTINPNITKDILIQDVLSSSYRSNQNQNKIKPVIKDQIYAPDNNVSFKKHSIGIKNTFYLDKENIEKLNEKISCPDLYDEEEKTLKRKKYATFINLDDEENILQKYKNEHNIDEEEPKEQRKINEKINENEAFYISHIKNYVPENDYEPSSNQSTPVVGTAETNSFSNEASSISSSKKYSKIYNKDETINIEKENVKKNENDEGHSSYILQKTRKNKFTEKINNTPETIPIQITEVIENKTTENEVAVDNEMSYCDNGNKTMTIYKNTNDPELKVDEEKKEKSDHKKFLSTEQSYKRKLRRYERKLVKKEIEASEKNAVIFEDIKYFRKHQNSFNIKNVINSSSSEISSDGNNKYVMNKGVIYLFEEGREVLGFEITSEKIVVINGTVEKLLLRLANESTYDEEYVDYFLQYHQFFISSIDLMHNLIARFNVQLESKEDAEESTYNKWRKQIQLKVIHVLNRWITIQYSCFIKNALIHRLLEYFLSAIWLAGYKNEADRIKRNITNTILSYSKKIRNLPFNLIPIKPLDSSDLTKEIIINLMPYSVLYDFDSKTIAKYLCVVDQEFFSVVTWHDIASKLSNSYKNEAYKILTPSAKLKSKREIEEDSKFDENPIDLMTKRSNLIRNWVAMEICSCQNIKTRKYLIRKFIEIAKYCRELNNFHSALFIVSGLLSPPVQRLKQTWELINNKEMASLNNLEKLLSPVSNMKYYRKTIAMAKGPVVPFFPIIMKDFRFIIDGNPTFKVLPNGVKLINFERYKIMNKVLKTMEKYSSEKYPFTASFLPVIQRLPSLIKQANRSVLIKDYLSDPQRNSSGSGTNMNATSQNYRISPHQGASTPVSDTTTLLSPEIQSPTLQYAGASSNRSLLQSNQSLFTLNLNPHHSFQNITNNALNTLFHGHSNSSFSSSDAESIAIYIESRLYGRGFCSPSISSSIATPSSISAGNITSKINNSSTLVNSNGNNTQSIADNFCWNENNDFSQDDNILMHILCSEFEIQNQKIAYDLSLACEPQNIISDPTSVSNATTSISTLNDSFYTSSSVKISYQKYISDSDSTKFISASNNINDDSVETSLAEKSLSIILSSNSKIKNFDYPIGNDNNQTKLNNMQNKIEPEIENNLNLSKIIPNDIHKIPFSSKLSS
ncbi:ras GEF [Piromyces finnis]|uniref:Ras GEF n=1 Tax=Piromyces finnis TaxID=1754191 RepID=A0A1Y1UYN0_9FUNG|nr:ras GEF [Piromyces finnis]|eukprot:ORX43597.1 ras GEF [Piromyces finnis]